MALTLKQFRSTRQRCEDLGKVLRDARWEGEPAATGHLYLGQLYIEDVQAHWPEASRKRGKYHLIIGNMEWISDDLAALEVHLFKFAKGEGYTMPEAKQ